jgi:hypothetical protein
MGEMSSNGGGEGVKPEWGIYRGVRDEIWDLLQFFFEFFGVQTVNNG